MQPSEKPAGKPVQQPAAEQQSTAVEKSAEPEPKAQVQNQTKQTQQPEEPQQPQGQQQEQVKAGDSQGSAGSSDGTGSEGGGGEGSKGGAASEEEGGPTGGWGDSFIKRKADGYLGNLLDLNSLMSPLRTCAADGFSLEVQEREAEDLLADEVAGRPVPTEAQLRLTDLLPKEQRLVSGTAHNLPCA